MLLQYLTYVYILLLLNSWQKNFSPKQKYPWGESQRLGKIELKSFLDLSVSTGKGYVGNRIFYKYPEEMVA